jgi:hypothetical protein
MERHAGDSATRTLVTRVATFSCAIDKEQRILDVTIECAPSQPSEGTPLPSGDKEVSAVTTPLATTRERRIRRGAALLIVLAMLMVSMTAATILLSTAADVHAHRRLARCESTASDLLDAADAPIQHWLEHESSTVILPPDVTVPEVPVLHDSWDDEDDTGTIQMTITAFDQLGMVPMQTARSGSPRRLTLPTNVTSVLDRLELPPASDTTPLGLDLVEAFGVAARPFSCPSISGSLCL